MEINIFIDDELIEHLRPDLIREDLKLILDQFDQVDLPKIILIEIPEYLYPLIRLLKVNNNLIEIYITKEIPKDINQKDMLCVEIKQKDIPKKPNILTIKA